MNHFRSCLLAFLSTLGFALWLNTAPVFASYSEEFSGVYSFGDSFTSPPKAWSDVITSRYGSAFIDNKTNFAIGGARTSDLAFMLANYQASVNGFDPNALYLVFMGPSDSASSYNHTTEYLGFSLESHNYGNTGLSFDDFKIQYTKGAFSFAELFPVTFADIQNRASLYGNFIKQVSDGGGQYIVVLNQFIDGLRQHAIHINAQDIMEELDFFLFFDNIWSNEFNKAVSQQIAAQAPNANIIFADTKRLVSEVTDNPVNYFTADEIQGTQYSQGFFRGSHPTIPAHKLLASYVTSIIESPTRISTLRELPIGFGQNVALDVRNLAIGRAARLRPDAQKVYLRATGEVEKVFSSTFSNKQLGFKDETNLSGGIAIDFILTDNLLIGGGIKYFENRADFAGNYGQAKVSEPNYSLHGIYNFNDSLFSYFAAAYGSSKYTINRIIPLGIAKISHKGKTGGSHNMESLGIGYLYSPANRAVSFTPFVNVTHQKVAMKPYTESGKVNSTTMSFNIPSRNSVTGEIGLRVDGKPFEIGRARIIPSLISSVAHEFNNPIKKRASARVSDMPKSFLVPTYKRNNDFVIGTEIRAIMHKALSARLNGSFKPIGRFNEYSIGASLEFGL